MRNAMLAMAMVGLAAGLAGCGGAAGWGGGKLIYRVSAASERDYVDENGCIWKADQAYAEAKKWGCLGGETVRRTEIKAVPGTKAPDVYLTERYSMDGYRFDVPNGVYTVRLHFAETYDGITQAGERVFTVKVQGAEAIKDLDVLKEAGKFATPLVKEVKGIEVTDGKLMIEFVPNVQNPEINGIEVFGP